MQSRIKELEKIERIEIPPEEKTIHFSFPQPKPSGRIVAEFEGVAKSIREERWRGQRSLPQRQLHDRARRPHRAGRRERRRQIDADQAAGRNRDRSRRANTASATTWKPTTSRRTSTRNSIPTPACSTISAMPHPARGETELRSLLGCFLFSDDDVFKKIGVLSGGERNRYALLRMLLHPANFLLLDEPTNHLDLRAKDVLLDALMKYTGTVVFVSHDRYFIDKLATRVFEVGDGKVEVFPGNYEDYLWRKQGGQHVAPTLDDVPGAKTVKGAPLLPALGEVGIFTLMPQAHRPTAIAEAATRNPKKRLNPIKRKQMEDRVHELESRNQRDRRRHLAPGDVRCRVSSAPTRPSASRRNSNQHKSRSCRAD